MKARLDSTLLLVGKTANHRKAAPVSMVKLMVFRAICKEGLGIIMEGRLMPLTRILGQNFAKSKTLCFYCQGLGAYEE